MAEQRDEVWVIFTDRKAPNNRKLKTRKWAENEELQKTYNFYIESDTSDIGQFIESLKEKPEVKKEVIKEKQNPQS